MTVEIVDGIKVLKLQDDGSPEARRAKADDMRTLAYLWQQLSGGHALRDATAFERKML